MDNDILVSGITLLGKLGTVTGKRPDLKQRGDSFLLKSCLLAAPQHFGVIIISDTALPYFCSVKMQVYA